MLDFSAIRTLKNGEKITEPGFYNIPLEVHHHQPCDGVSVTSGVLRTMELKTPADVWAFHLLNPDRFERKQSDALRLGRAMAAWVEGGEEAVMNHFMVLPADRPKRPTPQQISAYAKGEAKDAGIASVEFWAKVESDPRDIVSADEWQMICNMGKVLAADPHAAASLGGVPEITMAWYDEINRLWVLSRPDLVNFAGFVSDYKTGSDRGYGFNTRACDLAITQHGYHMQLALAAEAFEQLSGEWPQLAAIVFQLKEPPYHVIPRSVEEEELRMGLFQNRRARARFRECLDSGDWPGPGVDFAAYSMPDWFRERILNDMNTSGEAP